MKNKLIILLLLLCVCYSSYAQNPSANFTAVTVSGCSPLVVEFKDASTGNPTSWYWDFGNGATSTLQNPSTTFFAAGTYTIKLTVTNATASHTLTRTHYITVYERPVVDFIVNDSSTCFPHNAQFTDLSTAPGGNTNVAWLWDFGNGTQSTAQHPQVTYNNTGNYTVTLKVTNDKGCTSFLTKQQYVKIIGGMRAGFTNSLPVSCHPPYTISFTDTSTGPGTLSYQWNFGDGNTTTLRNPKHTYTSPIGFTVTLIVISSAGCTDTIVKVNPMNIQDINTDFTATDSICVNTPVSFQNASSPTPASFNWVFGDGNTSTQVNPVKTYTTPGTYSVKLYNNYSNCADSVIKTIKVLPKPIADFSATNTTSCQTPLTVPFQDASAGAVRWLWNFGDGNTSTQQNPNHTYTSYGSFNVQLIITNTSGCTDTIIRSNLIQVIQPQITIPSLPVAGCIPYTISPVATITTFDAVTSYLWDFGDGNTSTAANPSHTYTNQGTYNVTLTVTTSSGCTQTLSIPSAVKVGRLPVINFTANPNIACAFQEIQFNDLTNEGDEWQWHFGDGGSSNVKNPLYPYSDTGTFDVKLIVTNNGCVDSLEIEDFITIKPPIARFGYTPDCVDRLHFNFKDSSIGATSWFWNFGDGNTSTQQNPSHTYNNLGTYSVTLTVTNDTCSHFTTKIIRALDENPDFSTPITTACKTATIAPFTATSGNLNNITSYYWDFGNGISTTSNGNTSSNIYTQSGYYTVTLITTDLNGCFDTITKPNYIRINGPTANFTAEDTVGCKGLTTTFNDHSQDDGIASIVSWKWNFGDGNIQTYTSGPFQHTYNTGGNFNVTLVVTDAGGCSDSLTLPNLVFASDPKANFITADTATCPGASISFTNTSTAINHTNLWSFGDGNTSTAHSPSHTYTTPGNYPVRLVITDVNGCTDTLIKNNYVTVDVPIASFTVNDSISSCTPFEVIFTNTSQFYTSSLWDLGGGTSTLTNPIQYYNMPGIYQTKLIVTSAGGCTDSAFKTIRVYDTVGTTINYFPLNGCKPLTVTVNATTNGPMKYTWDFGDGVITSTTSPTINHVYNTFGEFIPKVIMTDPSGCIFPVTGPDTIRLKGAFANFGYDKKLFCDSGYVQFTDSTTSNDPIVNWTWDFGDGNISNQQHPNHHFTSPGIYSVSLSVVTAAGCTDTLLLSDIIKVVKSPLIAIGGDSIICINETILSSGIFLRSDTSAVQWKWNFPNGNTSTAQNPPVQQYNTAGNFTITATIINSSGCTDTTTKNILVNPLPTVTLPPLLTIQNGTTVTIPAVYTPNVATYNWTPVAGLSCTDCPQPVAGPKLNTKYKVNFVDSNGCKNIGEIQINVFCLNTNVFVPNTFSPNGDGSNDIFYVRGTGLDRVKSLRIFNRWGEIVFEQKDFPVNNPLHGWDGKFKGNKPQPDVYVYQVEVFCENSQVIQFEGNVALIQ